MSLKFKHLLCGIHSEEEHSNKKKKNRTKKKEKQQTLKPEKVVTSPGPDSIDHLILQIDNPDVRESIQQWLTEHNLELAEKESQEKETVRDLEERLCKSEAGKREILDVKNEEINKINQDLEDVREELESIKQELQVTREEKYRLESIVSNLQSRPPVLQYQRDSTTSNIVEALGTLVLPPQEKQRQQSQFSKEVKVAIRLMENFIGPRWKEFARVLDLPLEIIEDNDLAPDQRQSEIYWRIISEWQKRENITVTKISNVCQQLDINICFDKPMSGRHKRVLDKNRELVIHDLSHPKPVLYHMLRYLDIPSNLQEYVTSTEIRYERADRLLDILPVLGDQAFPVFTIALTNTGNKHIADQLFENPMPEEHRVILRKFEPIVIKYSDANCLVSCLAKYVTIPGCIHRYLLESVTRDTKMRRLLEILPCFGHNALDTLTKALDDIGCKQVASILKDKTGELQKLTKKEACTQMSPEDVDVLAREPRAPLTGHRRPARSSDRPNSSDNSDMNDGDELLWQDDYYTHEIMTKAEEAAMYETSIEQQVNMDYRRPRSIEILKDMDRVRVRYTTRGTELE